MAPNKGKGKVVAKQGQSSSPHPPDLESDAPKNVDHSGLIVSEVRHQQLSNNCWAIAIAVAVEAYVNKQRQIVGEKFLKAAPQYLIDSVQTQDEGFVTRTFRAWHQIVKGGGIGLEDDHPYVEPGPLKRKKKFVAKKRVSRMEGVHLYIGDHHQSENVKEKDILKLLENHPVVVTMKGYPSFENMKETKEIYRNSLPIESDVHVEHAIVLVGYGTNENEDGKEEHFFKCLNSYGAKWGENGYGKIIRTSSSGRKSFFTSFSYPTGVGFAA